MRNVNTVSVSRKKKNGTSEIIYESLKCDMQVERSKPNYYVPFKETVIRIVLFVDKSLITNPIQDRDIFTNLDTGEKLVALGGQYGGNLINKRVQVALDANIQ